MALYLANAKTLDLKSIDNGVDRMHVKERYIIWGLMYRNGNEKSVYMKEQWIRRQNTRDGFYCRLCRIVFGCDEYVSQKLHTPPLSEIDSEV